MTSPARTFSNPVIGGFNPDPSVCRVGDDYFLATSSFEYFPVPIYHSRDLVNWRQIGNIVNSESQLPFPDSMPSSHGIWAPTLRHHHGLSGEWWYLLIAFEHPPGAGDRCLFGFYPPGRREPLIPRRYPGPPTPAP